MKTIFKKQRVICFVMLILIIVTMALNVAAESNQLYIHNASAGFVKMTGSLYGYTQDTTTITLGAAITRTDYIRAPHTYTEVKLSVTLYENTTTGVSYMAPK